jgi:hypothetical protein
VRSSVGWAKRSVPTICTAPEERWWARRFLLCPPYRAPRYAAFFAAMAISCGVEWIRTNAKPPDWFAGTRKSSDQNRTHPLPGAGFIRSVLIPCPTRFVCRSEMCNLIRTCLNEGRACGGAGSMKEVVSPAQANGAGRVSVGVTHHQVSQYAVGVKRPNAWSGSAMRDSVVATDP